MKKRERKEIGNKAVLFTGKDGQQTNGREREEENGHSWIVSLSSIPRHLIGHKVKEKYLFQPPILLRLVIVGRKKVFAEGNT